MKNTIYQDRGVVCPPGGLLPPCNAFPAKGPGGFPVPTPAGGVREHESCCSMPSKPTVVCELKIPMANVAFAPLLIPGAYDITVSGLDTFLCDLEKNKKYWCAPSPEMPVVDNGGNALGFITLYTSPNPVDHEAQMISQQPVFFPWTPITLTDPALIDTDLYLAIWATKALLQLCPEDVNGDGVINVLDLIDVLLCFGLPAVPGCEDEDVNRDGVVNVLDLIDVLLAFGTACP